MDRDFTNVLRMRTPDPNAGKEMKRFMGIVERKYNTTFGNYRDFHKWSVDNLSEFWEEFWDFFGIICSKKYDKVIDLSVPIEESPEWFQGALLNFAENMLKYRDDRTALILASEDNETRTYTFSELYENAKLYAAAFRKFGLKKGDVAACYISNREEAIFAMLGAVSIGAIWTGALPILGPQAVLNRLKQVNPKILLTIDRFQNNKIEIEMLEKVKEIANGLPSLQKVLIVPSTSESKLKDISEIKNSCFVEDFLEESDGSVRPLVFEQVSFSHPVLIHFTSGTTGLPKAMMHGCGALFSAAKEFYLQLDCDRDSIWFSMSPVGWVSWSMIVPLSFCGVGIFLFEGVPYFLTPTHFWDLVHQYRISHLFVASNVAHDMHKMGYTPTSDHDLSCLKSAIVGGSIVKPQVFDFMYHQVKREIAFSSTYGCTEIVGTCLSLDPTLDVYRGELPAVCLGFDIQCLNEKGDPVEGEYGELVIAKPSPVLLLGLWNDPDGEKARKSYYSKYPGKFYLGDYGIINPVTKGFILCGRSDDTLKQRGCRFGSSEIYNVLESFPEVRDSLCVSHYSKELDERAVLFLEMEEGHSFEDKLVRRVREAVARELTPAHVPDVILETREIPYSVNGKKLEIIVKNIINNRPYNKESIANPDSLKNYYNIPELMDDL